MASDTESEENSPSTGEKSQNDVQHSDQASKGVESALTTTVPNTSSTAVSNSKSKKTDPLLGRRNNRKKVQKVSNPVEKDDSTEEVEKSQVLQKPKKKRASRGKQIRLNTNPKFKHFVLDQANASAVCTIFRKINLVSLLEMEAQNLVVGVPFLLIGVCILRRNIWLQFLAR